MRYELFYLVGASKETELEKIKEAVSAIITENGGVFEEKEVVERRKMSYEIKHETHGVYVTKRFDLEGEKIDEVIKKLNLESRVLRFVISRTENLPELKTKEERIQEASQKAAQKPKVEKVEKKPQEAKREEKKEEKEAEEPKKEKKKDIQEDIDKKLEEILNI